MTRFLRHNAVAITALFVALGGTGYAATQLPDHSVGTRQLRNHSVTPAKLAKNAKPVTKRELREAITQVVSDPATGLNITLSAKDGAQGPIGPDGPAGPLGPQGPKGDVGPKGDKGATGDAGGSWGYGKVALDGTLTAASGMTVTHPDSGHYCITAVLPVHVVVATVEGDGATTRTLATLVAPDASTPCDGSDAMVSTAVNGTSGEVPFYVMVN